MVRWLVRFCLEGQEGESRKLGCGDVMLDGWRFWCHGCWYLLTSLLTLIDDLGRKISSKESTNICH